MPTRAHNSPASPAPALSVMMPVFNEEKTVEAIIANVLARPEVGQVIVVDDGSTDRSWEILGGVARRDPRVEMVHNETNQGKGMAIRQAIGKLRMPFAIVQDADLEYDPRDYPSLLAPLLEGRADVVYGVRGFSGQTAFSFWFVVGNKAVSLATNILFNCYISDMETGYKVLRSDLWRRLNLDATGFDLEPEITGRVLRLGYRIHEIPIRYYARSREEGKKLTWIDGVQAFRVLLSLRLSSYERLFGLSDDPNYHRLRQVQLGMNHPLLSPIDHE